MPTGELETAIWQTPATQLLHIIIFSTLISALGQLTRNIRKILDTEIYIKTIVFLLKTGRFWGFLGGPQVGTGRCDSSTLRSNLADPCHTMAASGIKN